MFYHFKYINIINVCCLRGLRTIIILGYDWVRANRTMMIMMMMPLKKVWLMDVPGFGISAPRHVEHTCH